MRSRVVASLLIGFFCTILSFLMKFSIALVLLYFGAEFVNEVRYPIVLLFWVLDFLLWSLLAFGIISIVKRLWPRTHIVLRLVLIAMTITAVTSFLPAFRINCEVCKNDSRISSYPWSACREYERKIMCLSNTSRGIPIPFWQPHYVGDWGKPFIKYEYLFLNFVIWLTISGGLIFIIQKKYDKNRN